MTPFSRSSSRVLIIVLIAVLGINQTLITSAASSVGMQTSMAMLGDTFRIQAASAQTIIMPMANADGRTTSLKTMPTISEVPGELKGGDVVQNAMHVMIGTGSPSYAPAGISFDDPIASMDAWGADQNLPLSPDMEQRFNVLTNTLTCNFCCGSATDVTMNAHCGCAHAQAARGFFRYMLQTFGDTYTNDQLIGEAYRWQAIWYPAGVVQDYLLATGRGNLLPHTSHGGAGADGMHGVTVSR